MPMPQSNKPMENSLNMCNIIEELIPEKNADRINKFINDPSIREWVSGDFTGVLDATILVNNRDNIFFTSIHGGCGLIKLGSGIYELHTFVLPDGRGAWVKENFSRVRDWMFANTDTTEIRTLCPKNNRMAIGAARFCGFKKHSTMEKSCTHNGNIYDMDIYVLYKEVDKCQSQSH